MQTMITQWKFSVSKYKIFEEKRTNRFPEAGQQRSLPATPKLNYMQADRMMQELDDRHAIKTANELSKISMSGKTSAKHDSKAKQYSSMRHVTPSLIDNKSLIARTIKIDAKRLPKKESQFEYDNQPASLRKDESNGKLFEFDVEHVPDPSDSNFNNFLEGELEKIKRAFLEDTSSPMHENTVTQKNKDVFNPRSASIGQNKRDPLFGKKSSHPKIDPLPQSKKSLGQLGYKEKFEELYNKGKNLKTDSDSKKDLTNSIPRAVPGSHFMQVELKSMTDTNKVLSRYSKPQLTANHLQTFTPLFKADHSN
jgi:hypothetical protein